MNHFRLSIGDCEMPEYCRVFCYFLLTIAEIQNIYIIKDSVYNINMNYFCAISTAVGCNKENSLNLMFKMCYYHYLDFMLSILLLNVGLLLKVYLTDVHVTDHCMSFLFFFNYRLIQ